MSLNNNTTSLQAILTTVNALPDKVDTSGTATAADIYTGKTATVNDAKITGTNPYNAATVDPAVTSALAAIAEKGVDTTGKGLSDIAALVAAIEAGGGVKIAHGMVEVAEDTLIVEVTHGLGVIPEYIHVAAYRDMGSRQTYTVYATGGKIDAYSVGRYHYNFYQGSNASTNQSSSIGIAGNFTSGPGTSGTRYVNSANENSFMLGNNAQSSYYIRAGLRYYWIAIGGLP